MLSSIRSMICMLFRQNTVQREGCKQSKIYYPPIAYADDENYYVSSWYLMTEKLLRSLTPRNICYRSYHRKLTGL